MFNAILIPVLQELHISCEGKWPETNLVCFTDRDRQSPAYGASFDVCLPGEQSLAAAVAAISDSLRKKREQFKEGRRLRIRAAASSV